MKPIKGMALKRPCADCPFRNDIQPYLRPVRYREIASSLLDEGENFSCHKTLDYDGEDDRTVMSKARTCAGSMIWMQHQGRPNQMMQVMERLGAFDSARLDMDAPVYRTREAFEQAASPDQE